MASNIILTETKVDDSFLVDYVISSVEYPPDHDNGQCIVHFAPPHASLTLQVNLKEGNRDGEGLFVRDNGTPFMKVHFKNGVLDGEVTQFDKYSNVILKGKVVQGKESGLFVEYNEDGNEVWSGYYWHGKRHLELKKLKEMVGFYEERDSTNNVKSVSHFDPTRLCKDGISYELMNGKVVRVCEYKDGLFQRTVMEMKNNVLTEYDRNGNKMYEGGYSGNMKKGFKREGEGTEYGEDGKTAVYIGEWGKGHRNGFGVEYKNHQVMFSGNWKNGKRNGNKKRSKKQRLHVVNEKAEWLFGPKMVEKCVSFKHWRPVIWSLIGVVLLGVVIGIIAKAMKSTKEVTFGSCEDMVSFPMEKEEKMRRLIFKKGFDCEGEVDLSRFVNCEKIEIGKDAMERVNRIDIGGLSGLKEIIVGDNSCGELREVDVKGSQYTQLHSLKIGSNALNGLTMVPLNAFSNLVTIVVGSSSLNGLASLTWTSTSVLRSLSIGSSSLQKLRNFRISEFTNLQSVRIGSNSLTTVRELELKGLWNMERLEVNEGGLSGVERVEIKDVNCGVLSSFGISICSYGYCFALNSDAVLKNVKYIEVGEKALNEVNMFSMDGLGKLETLIVGVNSLNGTMTADCRFTIQNCPELKTVDVKGYSFMNYVYVVIKDCNGLQSILMGNATFQSVQSVEMERLPQLGSITLGWYSMNGCNEDYRKSIEEEPYNYKNTLSMKSMS